MRIINGVVELEVKELSNEKTWNSIQAISLEHKRATVFFDGNEVELPAALLLISNHFESIYYCLKVGRKVDVPKWTSIMPQFILEKLWMLPVDFEIQNPDTLSCIETRNLYQNLRMLGCPCKVLPYRDYKVFDDLKRISTCFEYKIESESNYGPKISVIIPTRDYREFLKNVVIHLISQSLSPDLFEIVIVDDGGVDQSAPAIQSLVAPLAGRINIKYLYLERTPDKQNEFRAGICRNIGLIRSSGEQILFLDSDILVAKTFLSNILETIADYDVVQFPRHHIKSEFSSDVTKYSDIDAAQTFIEEERYWGYFFSSSTWADLPAFWRYTCTYCLVIKRSALIEVGFFREVFRSYGFEDTELGFRLARGGKKFYLSKEPVYHLTPRIERSRYQHSMIIKKQLLLKTAKVFYLSTLDEEVFYLFQGFLRDESPFFQLLYSWISGIKRRIRGLFRKRLQSDNLC